MAPFLVTLLISSAGRRVELIECFRSSARELGLDLRVLAVDVNLGMSAACQAADAAFPVPRCTTPGFVPELVALCAREHVQLVVPTIDTELKMLADHQTDFRRIGTRVVVSSADTVRLARDKAATARFLSAYGIPSPRTALLAEVLDQPGSWSWPLMLKPIAGSSSVGIRQAQNLDDARRAAAERPDFLAQELLRGGEYTVNLFFDHSGALRAAVPHHRYEVRAGEVSKGITERHPGLTKLAWQLGSALKGAQGPLCFQAIVSEDGPAHVFEINARFGGGYPLAHQAGAPFTRWLLEEAAGLPSSACDNWQAGVVMLRYDAALFSHTGPL